MTLYMTSFYPKEGTLKITLVNIRRNSRNLDRNVVEFERTKQFGTMYIQRIKEIKEIVGLI